MRSQTGLAETFFYVLEDKLRILFVDDDPILREFATVHLAADNVEIVVAANGGEAWRLLHYHSFDLILLDLEMPEVDGFEFLQSIRGQPDFQRIPVIVVTGREDVSAVDRAFQEGATSFVVKPINWRLLSYQVRFVYQAHQTERSLIEARARARAEAVAASEALRQLAQSSAEFVTKAVDVSPALRAQAKAYFSMLNSLNARETDPAES